MCANARRATEHSGRGGRRTQSYVLGGEGDREGAMPIVAYNPREDTWTQKKAATRARHCWGAQFVSGKVYIFGTPDRKESPQPLLEEYDPVTDTIKERTPLPRPRMAYATAVVDGQILVLGGSPGESVPLGSVDIYDPKTDAWTIAPDLPKAKCWLGAAAVDRKLYVLGGVAGDFSNPDNGMYALDITRSSASGSLEPRPAR